MDTFYAIKKNQTHVYDKNGKRLFITRLEAKALTITQVKLEDKDGYNAVQVGVSTKKRLNKPEAGHTQKAKVTPLHLREIKLSENNDKKIGDQIEVSEAITIGDLLDVRAKGKGCGFAGVVKRWHFAGGPATHGQSDRQRSPGSIGQGTSPGRIWKGKRMAGRMGGKYVTNRGSKVVYISQDKNELWLTGSVPGHKDSLVRLDKVGHKDFIGIKEK